MGNVFRSVLAAARAVLQNKTVTAGTSDITVTADAGYDGLGTVTVEPTPSTSITPSDSSPTSMSSGSTYTPTTSGYAIKNSPTTLTPNNSSPPSISSGTIYKGGGSGYAIASYTSLSTSWLQTLSANTIYKNGSSIQYAMSSYSSSSVNPSSSGALFNSGWNYMNSGGYAYYPRPSTNSVKIGTATLSTSSTTAVSCGFKPKYLCAVILMNTSGAIYVSWIYDETVSTSKYWISGTASYLQVKNLSTSDNNNLYSINTTGFTANKVSKSDRTSLAYFAIG